MWKDDAKTRFEFTLAPHKYAATIHAINSGVIKLSKLTVVGCIYRGMAGTRLPSQFWKQDAAGVTGGTEFAFSSTTRSRRQAEFYAKVDDDARASTLLETRMGMVDRGADIGDVSQFPGEEEILYGPRTGIEACEARVDGATLVVDVKMSVNMRSRTLEEATAQRTTLLYR